jgi:hypothetical protein
VISGRVASTVQTLVFRVEEGQLAINISGGLLAYKYQFEVDIANIIYKQLISGWVTNTGQTLVFRVEEGQLAINITGGPLAYKYQFKVGYSGFNCWHQDQTLLTWAYRGKKYIYKLMNAYW